MEQAMMNAAAATAHTFKEATSVAEGDVPARVRIELKDRIPAEANVRYAPFASLAPGMSVAVPSQPMKGLSPAKLAEAWASAPWVEGVVV